MAASFNPREFTFPNATKLLNQEYTCITSIEREVPVGLSPRYIGNEAEFIRKVLSSKLGKYDERLQSIPVSFRKVRRLGTTGIICGEDPNIYFKLLVEFLVFQPVSGSKVLAKIEKTSKSHIGLHIHEWFNGSIERNNLNKNAHDLDVGDVILVEVLQCHVLRKQLSLTCRFLKTIEKAPKRSVIEVSEAVNNHKSFADSGDEENHNSNKPNGYDSGIDCKKKTPNSPDKPVKSKKKRHHKDAAMSDESESNPSPEKKKLKKDLAADDQGLDITQSSTFSTPDNVEPTGPIAESHTSINEDRSPSKKQKKHKSKKIEETEIGHSDDSHLNGSKSHHSGHAYSSSQSLDETSEDKSRKHEKKSKKKKHKKNEDVDAD